MNLSVYCQIPSVGNFLPRIFRVLEGVVGEVKSVSWGGARTKVEVHKRKLTKNMFLHIDLLILLSSPLTQLFFTIIKPALGVNKVKRNRAINQSNRIIHMLDLRKTLPKYLRTILNKFEAMTNSANGPIIFTYYAESELSLPSRN